jgi:hypothetical protein
LRPILNVELVFMRIKILIALLICSSIYFFSCKEPDSIGLDLVEDELQNSTIDTITLFAYSEIEDSVLAVNIESPTYPNYAYQLVGNYLDPVFGEVQCGFHTQFDLENSQQDFGESPHVDSIVLMLEPYSRYGNTSEDMSFKVYRITQDFYKDSVYYLTDKLEHESIPIADTTFAPQIGDTIVIGDSTEVEFHYRIRLDKSFGEDLIELSTTTNAYDSFDDFVKEMKGLYIETNKRMGGGSILNMDLNSTHSQMVLYYNDSLSYVYPINNKNCGKFTHAEHDYEYAHQLLKNQLDGDTSLGMQYMFVQPLAGIATKIQLPYLKDWDGFKDIGVNNARLIIEVDELVGDTLLYPIPNKLALKEKVDGEYVKILDDQDNYLDGYYYSAENAYIFNITRYLQSKILNGENEYSLYLMSAYKATTADRVVLKGPASTENKMKIKVVYTKF